MKYTKVFTKDFAALAAVLVATTKLAKEGLALNRTSVEETAKVYSDYRAISEKEAEVEVGAGENELSHKESIPTPPQHLTATQADVISAYIVRTLLSKPQVITVPQVINQPEVSTGVENFMVSCQNRYDWRLKLNKIIHGMTKYGPSGLLVIPRPEGIDFEAVTPGNGFYNIHKKEGMAIIQKDYDYLMELLQINSQSLTTMGKEILESPEILHHISAENYSMGYHEIEKDNGSCKSDNSHLTDSERSRLFLASIPVPEKKGSKAINGAYSGMHIADDCNDTCFTNDDKFGEVSDIDKLEVLSRLYELTFNTVHLDNRLANVNGIPGATKNTQPHRSKYLIMSINGFPLFAKVITSEMVIMCDLKLSTDNETAETLVQSLSATERYNNDFTRAVLLGLKDIVNKKNVHYDPEVFQRLPNGRYEIKSHTDLEGRPINPKNHVYSDDSSATNIAALTQTLPSPAQVADEVTGNNPMLSAQHTRGNRTAVEGQNLTTNSESRFFVYAGNFFMTIVNSFAGTSIEIIKANPSWIQIYNVEQDRMVEVSVDDLIAYGKNYYREQTGLIPTSGGSPDLALAIMNMFSTIPSLAQERDVGDVVTYFAKTGGFMDFPELRRPHTRGERLNTSGSGQLSAGTEGLARQLAAGNDNNGAPNLTDEQLAQQDQQAQQPI